VNTLKFRDLFLPKIVNSDPKKRKEAVLKENNKDLLRKVVENDADKDVRDSARMRLKELGA